MANFSSICPFLNNSNDFAFGVEFGSLLEKMKTKDMIGDYFLIENQEQICLACNRLRWDIVEMEVWKGHEEYIWISMKKRVS